jgi:hypothetical protein
MRALRRLGGDAAALTHFPLTLEIAGTIQTSRRHNHRCVFWKPKMLRIQATAASLGGIDRIWLPTCLIKALLSGGRENGVHSGSLSVVSWKIDALQYFREKNSELVDVMVFRCLIQVGQNFGIAMRRLLSLIVMYFHGTKNIFAR